MQTDYQRSFDNENSSDLAVVFLQENTLFLFNNLFQLASMLGAKSCNTVTAVI